MTVKEIVLLRHGQTDWNRDYRFQGHSDVALNAQGQQQALACRERIEAWDPQEIWASSLERALVTACLATGRDRSSLHVTDDLKELSFGCWEGLTVEEIQSRYGEQYRLWMEDPSLATPQGAETFRQCMARAGRAMDQVLQSPARRCLLVAHGGIFRALLAQVLAMAPASAWRVKLGNCSFTGLETWRGKLWLSFLNDDAHLRDATGPLPLAF